VKSLASENGSVHLVVRLRVHDEPQGNDVVTQAWILISTSRSFFAAKDLKVRYEIEGEQAGRFVCSSA
jgi:hypothetical protein